MKKFRFLASLLIIIAVSFIITGYVWAQECDIEPMEGRIIVDFGMELPGLCSPQEFPSVDCFGTADPVSANPAIPSGSYDITLQSYDEHSIKPDQTQLNESYFLRLRNGVGELIVSTNATDDLPNDEDNLIQLVNESLFVGEDIGSIMPVHFCDTSTGNACVDNPNSILPICVAFDLIDEFGGEGCTPGYWMQCQHFGSWTFPLTPDTKFSDMFGSDAFGDMTLLQVLNKEGDFPNDLRQLGFHAVAALLNAASQYVDYDRSTMQVKMMFNNALTNGNIEEVKNIFEEFNEQECPIGLNPGADCKEKEEKNK